MNKLPAHSEAGITLFVALLAMTIVGGIAHRLFLHAEAYRDISHTFANSLAIQQRLRRQIDSRSALQRGCAIQRLSISDRNIQEWLACSRGFPPFLTNHPIRLPDGRIDYNSLFASPSPCPGQRHNAPEESATLPRSATTCELPSRLMQGLAALDNLHCRDLVVERSDDSGPLILTTVGSLVCDGVLTITASSLIVAGGDIRIAAVAAASSTPIAITMISAHGGITVGGTSGPISLLGLSRSALNVPLSPVPRDPPLPPFTMSRIAGVRAVDGS